MFSAVPLVLQLVLEVSASSINHGSADVSSNGGSLMSLLDGTISTFGNNTEYQASSDAYSAQAILPKGNIIVFAS